MYLFLSLAVLAAGGVAFVYFYKDRIIQLMVGEFNKYLNAKVSVEKITLNIWETFPEVSLHFYNTKISSSLPGDPELLADIRNIYFGFNVQDALNGTVLIKDFRMEDGTIRMRVTEYGAVNYNIFKSDSSSEGKVKVDLKEVVLNKIDYSYSNEEINQSYALYADWSKAKIHLKDEKFIADWSGEYLVKGIQVGNNTYFKLKSVSLSSQLAVDTKENTFTLFPSQLSLGRSAFTVNALWNFSQSPSIDLEVKGKNTNIQTLLSLLPENISKDFSVYKSTGEVYFNGKVSGSLASHQVPAIDVQFGCKNASFFHPGYKKKISNANFMGNYTTSQGQSRLELRDISCQLDGSALKGYFFMEDFADPFMELRLESSADINALLAFYPVKEIKTSSGNLEFAIDFKGRMSELKSSSLNKNITVKGKIKISELNIQTISSPWAYENIHGNIVFDNNEIDIKELTGKIGKSDAEISGVITNLIPFLSDSAQMLKIKGKLSSSVLDFNELLPPTNSKKTAGNSFHPLLHIDLEGNVKTMHFRKITARNIQTKFLLKDKTLDIKKMHADAFGGQVRIQGTCTDTLRQRFSISLTAVSKNTYIDSIFYCTDNFSQEFMKSENIKGQLNADFTGKFMTDHQFSIIPESFKGTLKTEIKNGELVSFEPMKKLSNYVDEKELENIRFSTLQNTL
ncbi:MAG: AsmA family protein, partial [Cytophagales bacterium]|nr:AsmA family protein [Cytophagales bacterium]